MLTVIGERALTFHLKTSSCVEPLIRKKVQSRAVVVGFGYVSSIRWVRRKSVHGVGGFWWWLLEVSLVSRPTLSFFSSCHSSEAEGVLSLHSRPASLSLRRSFRWGCWWDWLITTDFLSSLLKQASDSNISTLNTNLKQSEQCPISTYLLLTTRKNRRIVRGAYLYSEVDMQTLRPRGHVCDT